MKNNAFVQPLILAALLAFGFAVVWGLFGLWTMEVVEYAFHVGTNVESLNFLADGTPCIGHRLGGQDNWHYTDLEGRPIAAPEDQEDPWLGGSLLTAKLPQRAARGDVSWQNRICPLGDGRTPTNIWYFVSDGTAYFVGYDTESKAQIGYLGTAGFRPSPPPPEEGIPFGGPASGVRRRVLGANLSRPGSRHLRAPRGYVSPGDIYVLGRGGKIYHADLRSRTVEIVFDDPRFRSAVLLPDVSHTERGTLYRLAVRTEDTLLVMDERGTVLRRYPIPAIGRERELMVLETNAGEAVIWWQMPVEQVSEKVDHHICWVRPDGGYRHTSIALASNHSIIMTPAQLGVALPSPILLFGGVAFFLAPNRLYDETTTYSQAVMRELRQFWPALAIAQVLAVGLAVLCYRRQKRYGLGRGERIAWPLFVLLLGLPGWIGYRFGRKWPELESCPDCGVAVPRDRASCSRCANEFPTPALKGTEVFA